MIEVYTKPQCPQCDMTKNLLAREGADFDVIDVTRDAVALEVTRDLGYSAAPVVVVTGESGTTEGRIVDHWSGFKPERIRAACRGK